MHTRESKPMGVRVTSRLVSQWTQQTIKKLDAKVLGLSTRIHRDAMRYAPRDTGNLISSGRIKRNGEANYSVIFGGGSVRYARVRHYINRKTPGSLRYLERAGDQNSRTFVQELRNI